MTKDERKDDEHHHHHHRGPTMTADMFLAMIILCALMFLGMLVVGGGVLRLEQRLEDLQKRINALEQASGVASVRSGGRR